MCFYFLQNNLICIICSSAVCREMQNPPCLFSNCVFIQYAIHSKFWQSVYFADRTDELYKKMDIDPEKSANASFFCVRRRRRRKIIHMALYEDVSLLSSRDAQKLGLSPRGGALLPPHGIQGEMQFEKKAKGSPKKKWMRDGLNFRGKYVASFFLRVNAVCCLISLWKRVLFFLYA